MLACRSKVPMRPGRAARAGRVGGERAVRRLPSSWDDLGLGCVPDVSPAFFTIPKWRISGKLGVGTGVLRYQDKAHLL